jgi:hypothetical protein
MSNFVWYICCNYCLFSGAIGSVNLLPAFHCKPMFISINKEGFYKEGIVGSSFIIQFARWCLLMKELSSWYSVLILISVWWILPFSCVCCLRIWLCPAKSMLLCGYLSFILLCFDISCHLVVSCFVCRIPCRIFGSGGMVVIYGLSFYFLWNIFIALSILNDSFAM